MNHVSQRKTATSRALKPLQSLARYTAFVYKYPYVMVFCPTKNDIFRDVKRAFSFCF
jgi:hypothetical protein